MYDPLIVVLSAAGLGQALLCLALLRGHDPRRPSDMPLAMIFVALTIVLLLPIASAIVPSARTFVMAITLPAHLSVAPAFWLYVQSLTAHTPWRFERRHLSHFLPSLAGCTVALLTVMLPDADRIAMLIRDEYVDRAYPATVAILIFILVLVWMVQFTFYGWRILARLSRYRQMLKTLFSSNESRELWWLSGLGSTLAVIWLMALAGTVAENLLNQPFLPPAAPYFMALITIGALAFYGLNQRPGLEGRYLEAEEKAVVEEKKYQKSALTPEQAQRIVSRMEAAMQTEGLFLDANLSLQKLAKHISVSPNHISQTLNEKLGQTFFDYVNQWRVNAAIPMVLAGEMSILDVALEVGFNAKSSFYKAFKAVTGMTPTQYRSTPHSRGYEA